MVLKEEARAGIGPGAEPIEGSPMPANAQALIEKIQALPPEKQEEIEDFIDFVQQREQERSLTRAAAALSAPAFAAIWNNLEDEVYNAL